MFELRTLRYFIAFVDQGGISKASQAMHITEPTFSRQIGELERRVGKPLYKRINKRIILTKEGEALYDYAKEIIQLADRAEEELTTGTSKISGSVLIGAGGTVGMKIIAEAIDHMQQTNPEILTEFYSGASLDQMEQLSKGLLDFVLETELVSRPGYERLEFPIRDTWVAYMREDDPLAKKKSVKPKDFEGRNVILPRQAMKTGVLNGWFGESLEKTYTVATQNLTLNSMFIVKQGLGYSFTYDGLFEIPGLVHRPLKPVLEDKNGLIWSKKHPLSTQAQVFLDCVRKAIEEHKEA